MKLIALVLLGVIANSALADDFKAVPPSVYLDYAYGSKGHDFELALGLQQQKPANSFGGVYYGQDHLERGGKTESLGALAFILSPTPQSSYGAKVSIGLSRTTALSNYVRKGLEVGAIGYDFLTNNFSLFAGAILRPTLFSNRYKSSSEIEYASKVGLNYHVRQGLEVFAQYHYTGILDNKYASSRLASGFQAGISILY